jgi:hypothetical protein
MIVVQAVLATVVVVVKVIGTGKVKPLGRPVKVEETKKK